MGIRPQGLTGTGRQRPAAVAIGVAVWLAGCARHASRNAAFQQAQDSGWLLDLDGDVVNAAFAQATAATPPMKKAASGGVRWRPG
jgi:hypothetical protein